MVVVKLTEALIQEGIIEKVTYSEAYRSWFDKKWLFV
ncbi:hypothetical protein J2R98_001547 [Alkalibacillus filiformis]|uniref:Uncharacterized protein n=1 Tax=Alkalibacillus filiformis TaxID=200990 RepID=A0ABU0DUA4_9BACI|nr:hypothetical protein [Alkalibacillus filiformis]